MSVNLCVEFFLVSFDLSLTSRREPHIFPCLFAELHFKRDAPRLDRQATLAPTVERLICNQ